MCNIVEQSDILVLHWSIRLLALHRSRNDKRRLLERELCGHTTPKHQIIRAAKRVSAIMTIKHALFSITTKLSRTNQFYLKLTQEHCAVAQTGILLASVGNDRMPKKIKTWTFPA